MNDEYKIFQLYLESIEEEQPQMIADKWGTKEWSLHGKLHREDGAAVEYADSGKEWWLHGKLHRADAPAIEHADGTKEWYLHGKLHREDGAAIEYANGDKEWWLHGKLHREDGAAIEYDNGDKEWYLHGVEYYTPEAWAEALLKQRNKPHDAAAVDAFLKQILSKEVDAAL